MATSMLSVIANKLITVLRLFLFVKSSALVLNSCKGQFCSETIISFQLHVRLGLKVGGCGLNVE